MQSATETPIAGFRMLHDNELEAVTGGIIVTGDPNPPPPTSNGIGPLAILEMMQMGGMDHLFEDVAQEAPPDEQSDHEIVVHWTELSPGVWDTDGDGQGDLIVVTGNPGTIDGFVPMPINPATGISHYMYPEGPNGQADTSQPPVFTPEGFQWACDTYEAGTTATDQAMTQGGLIGTLTGIFGGPAGSIPLVTGIAGLAHPHEPIEGCGD